MRVHYLQHVAFEDLAAIRDWAESRGHTVTSTELFREPGPAAASAAAPTSATAATPAAAHPATTSLAAATALPALDDIDMLVIMGGPMGAYDYAEHPWLRAEKAFILAAVIAGKAVLGICLGAQLIADVLSGPVTKNAHKEVGWYPVELTDGGRAEPLFAGFPPSFPALHWHGDTFAIPPGATHAASSAACADQAFSLDGGRVAGLQFHLEETPESLGLLVEHAAAELNAATTEPWVASREELLAADAPYDACRGLLFKLLDRMAARMGADAR